MDRSIRSKIIIETVLKLACESDESWLFDSLIANSASPDIWQELRDNRTAEFHTNILSRSKAITKLKLQDVTN